VSTSEEDFRRIVDTIPAMVWTALPDGNRDFVNHRYLEYTGLSIEESLGTSFPSIHPEDRVKFIEKWKAAVSDGNPIDAELRLRRTDGKYRWFQNSLQSLRDGSGNIVKWYAIATDIEDRKNAEDRLRLVLDGIPTLIWTTNQDLSEDFYNQRWLEYTGLRLEDMQGTNWMGSVHPEDLPQHADSAASHMKVKRGCELRTAPIAGSWIELFRCAIPRGALSAGLEPTPILRTTSGLWSDSGNTNRNSAK
jgi:PAS domain S-box-containing protein